KSVNYFFFQAEDGIRDFHVTGVQTCALPIYFAIASNSKAFTTTALAILVEEGKIKWTDKVINHIPEFKMYNAYVTENFNIQDLRSEERRVGKSVDLDRRGITKKNKHRDESMQ